MTLERWATGSRMKVRRLAPATSRFKMVSAGSAIMSTSSPNRNASCRLRRFDATLTNSDLERLESGQCRQPTVGIGFALDEMHKGLVVETQRKIAKAFRVCGLQFCKHPGNQLGVSVGHIRLSLIPDQGSFHRALLRSRGVNWSPINVLDVRRLQKESAVKI